MSGAGHTTKSISSTGDQTINGVLSGVAWNDGTIYYSFPTSSSEYAYTGEPDTFSSIPSSMWVAIDFALNTLYGNAADDGFSVEGFTNLNVEWTTSSNAHIRLANSSSGGTTAWAYYPSTSVKGGDVWFFDDYGSPQAGNYEWHTILHEIGHALGLKHGHETDTYGALPFSEDSMEYSIMTYKSYVGHAGSGGYTNETWGYAQTYMMADIAALQHMYGADFTTNSDNTVYKWSPASGQTLVNGAVGINAGSNRIFATIWDGGGVDTYDLSAYSTGVTIDLNPGGHSVFSSTQLAYLGAGHYASGNIYNALLYNGDTRSLIENVTCGTGNDSIYLNSYNSNNLINGNLGTDTVYVTYSYGSGYSIQYGSTATNLVMLGTAGTDTFQNCDYVHFADGTTVTTASLLGSTTNAAPHDFNNDGTSDMLVRHAASGYVSYGQINGGAVTQWRGITGLGTDWNALDVGDFDGDGRSDDILVRHSSGYVSYGQTENGVLTSWRGITGLSTDWQVVGAGDFDGDGRTDDILVRHSSGYVSYGQTDNGSVTSWHGVTGLSTDWQVMGAGDFDSDGRSDDILVRHTASGYVSYGQTDNGSVTAWRGLTGVSTDWLVVT